MTTFKNKLKQNNVIYLLSNCSSRISELKLESRLALLFILFFIGTNMLNKPCSTAEPNHDFKKHVLQVINENSRLEKTMFDKLSNLSPTSNREFETYANHILTYTQTARSIDLSKCPTDFAQAFYRHITAWERKAVIVKNHPHIKTNIDTLRDSIMDQLGSGQEIRKLLGVSQNRTTPQEDVRLAQKWQQDITSVDSEIYETWNMVSSACIKYDIYLK